MKNDELQIFLKLAISNIQLACIKVEIDYPPARFSDPERQGMVAAYTEVSTALENLLEDKSIKPALIKLLDGWFEMQSHNDESANTPFETGYFRALRNSIGDMEYLLDE